MTLGENMTVTDQDLSWYPLSCLVAGIVGLISNLLVSTVLLKQIRNKPYTMRYSLSLSMGNLIYCVAAICVMVRAVTADRLDQPSCSFYIFVDFFGYYTCVTSLILLAMERLCAIRFPTYFRRMTTSKNITLQIAVSWAISLVLTLYPASVVKVMPVTANTTTTTTRYECASAPSSAMPVYNLIFDMVLPFGLFTGLTVCAMYVLKKRSAVSVVGGGSSNGGTRNRVYAGSERSLKKSWLRLTFIAVMFMLCFGSYFIFALVPIIVPSLKDNGTLNFLGEFIQVLTYTHTWLNPMMHYICDPSFRFAFAAMFRRKQLGRAGQHEYSRETVFSIG